MKNGVDIKYINIIKNMYSRVVVNNRTCNYLTSVFSSQLDYVKDLYLFHLYLP